MYDPPPGACTFLIAAHKHASNLSLPISRAWQDLCDQVRKGELPAYVISLRGMTYQASRPQFAQLATREPASVFELETETAGLVRGACFLMLSDFDVPAPIAAGSESGRVTKSQRVLGAIAFLYHGSRPNRKQVPNKELVFAVRGYLKDEEISDRTILRAAGRYK